MIIEMEIPDYDGNGIDFVWEDGSNFNAKTFNESVIIQANSKALLSFAKQMLYMAVNDLPFGSHVHYDDYLPGKQNHSMEIIIEKV